MTKKLNSNDFALLIEEIFYKTEQLEDWLKVINNARMEGQVDIKKILLELACSIRTLAQTQLTARGYADMAETREKIDRLNKEHKAKN